MKVNERIEVNGFRGTIRYIGPVPADSNSEFIGVEWDDPSRGKHDGTYKNIKYFQTSSLTAGSFLNRQLKDLKIGQDFLTAMKEKYLTPSDMEEDRDIALGGNEKIQVETVGWEKVYKKQKNLKQLTIAGLDGRCIRGAQDENVSKVSEETIAFLCPNIEDLDLSRNLFTQLEQVADICINLKNLFSLRLNENRFHIDEDFGSVRESLSTSFMNVTHLSLSGTMMTWKQLLHIEKFFPVLTELNFAGNQIESLQGVDSSVNLLHLTTLNLERNQLKEWAQVNHLGHLKNLQRLMLNENLLYFVSYPSCGRLFEKLKVINLTSNQFQDWDSIHELNRFPCLTDIRFKENPVLASVAGIDKNHYLLIARLSKATHVNKSYVSERERRDAELYYFTMISQHKNEDMELFLKGQHANYDHLAEKFKDFVITTSSKQTIKKDLLQLTLEYDGKVFKKGVMEKVTIRVLKSMVTRLFQLKPMATFAMVVYASDGRTFTLDNLERELSFYSVTSEDKVVVDTSIRQ